ADRGGLRISIDGGNPDADVILVLRLDVSAHGPARTDADEHERKHQPAMSAYGVEISSPGNALRRAERGRAIAGRLRPRLLRQPAAICVNRSKWPVGWDQVSRH